MPGTLPEINTAEAGECLNQLSGIDYPPADHRCPYYSEDPNIYERTSVKGSGRSTSTI